MASRKRKWLSVWGVLARLGLTGDRDGIIQHVFEMASRVSVRSQDGEPMDGDAFLVETFEALGTTDGDSIRFRPDEADRLDGLAGPPCRPAGDEAQRKAIADCSRRSALRKTGLYSLEANALAGPSAHLRPGHVEERQ